MVSRRRNLSGDDVVLGMLQATAADKSQLPVPSASSASPSSSAEMKRQQESVPTKDTACKIRRMQNKAFKNRATLLQAAMNHLNELSELDKGVMDHLEEQENIINKFQEHANTAMETVVKLDSRITTLQKEVCTLKQDSTRKTEELASKNKKIMELQKREKELLKEQDKLKRKLDEKDRRRHEETKKMIEFMQNSLNAEN
jgi:chromosome segregation ATPase